MRRWRRGAFVRVKMTVANVAFESSFSCGAIVFATHSPKQVVQHADGNGGIGESIASLARASADGDDSCWSSMRRQVLARPPSGPLLGRCPVVARCFRPCRRCVGRPVSSGRPQRPRPRPSRKLAQLRQFGTGALQSRPPSATRQAEVRLRHRRSRTRRRIQHGPSASAKARIISTAHQTCV